MANTHRAAKAAPQSSPGRQPGDPCRSQIQPHRGETFPYWFAPPVLCFQARKDPGLTPGATFSRRSIVEAARYRACAPRRQSEATSLTLRKCPNSRPRIPSECEPAYDLTLTGYWNGRSRAHVDPSETASGISRAARLRCPRICRCRIWQAGAVEDVRELDAYVESGSALGHLEITADGKVLLRLPLLPVIAVVGRAGSECSRPPGRTMRLCSGRNPFSDRRSGS